VSIRSALRSLSKTSLSFDEFIEYQKQVGSEHNDRGACLLMAANVEIALDAAIFHILKWDSSTREQLVSPEGPLGTFSQKIHLGRALGIYGEQTYYNLDMVRHIRNVFAHAHRPITFETKEVKEAVFSMKPVTALPPVAKPAVPSLDTSPVTSRASFRRTCDLTAHNLMIGIWFPPPAIPLGKPPDPLP